MPTYEYRCPDCENSTIEVVRSVSEAEPTAGYMCPTCTARMERVWVAAPVKFNATGFYSTGG